MQNWMDILGNGERGWLPHCHATVQMCAMCYIPIIYLIYYPAIAGQLHERTDLQYTPHK